ncbi:hypothetical protein DERP_007142 [Dermatophagoides pteronyssinus]|uniref:Glycosyltransferase family 92 protein n=1 Tax=Dermatophagoides pteronyssinus TaxID=6956 RepID=A0ABQ8JUG8_DERPT|nr:hypothetical protein DERP_007142 [Dermatophagoides pteronyssinus]
MEQSSSEEYLKLMDENIDDDDDDDDGGGGGGGNDDNTVNIDINQHYNRKSPKCFDCFIFKEFIKNRSKLFLSIFLFIIIFETYIIIILESILPKRKSLNKLKTLSLIELESNLAALYTDEWQTFSNTKWLNQKLSMIQYCDNISLIPIHEIKQANIYWQTIQSPLIDLNMNITLDAFDPFTIYIYNAYYDDRSGRSEVKILTSCDQQVIIEKLKFGCLLWFDDQKAPVIGNITEVFTIWPKYWDFGIQPNIYGPQIITCRIPEPLNRTIPRAITLTSKPMTCDLGETPVENVVRVIHRNDTSDLIQNDVNRNQNFTIGVCVHAFRYRTYDFSVRLIEWLEMNRLLGASKIYFYIFDATESVYRVLRHYAKEGLIEWRRLTLPGVQPNIDSMYEYYYKQINGKSFAEELLELNDCLYRNIYRHDYIGLFDIDEILMPQKQLQNWFDVLNRIKKRSSIDEKQAGYLAHKHSYVYEMYEEIYHNGKIIPSYMHIMRHTYRAKPYQDGKNTKCFHRTDKVSAIHNHFPIRCINRTGFYFNCEGITFDENDESILMHYRPNRQPDEQCMINKTNEQILQYCTINDHTAWKWYDLLVKNVRKKLITIFGNDE